jgi:hypothetical protein
LLSFSFETNSSQGFSKSLSQFSSILKIATSQVEPNLFFKLLKSLISSYLSHSKYKTVSTKCSKVFGQARFQSLFTCQMMILVIFLVLQKSTIFSATSFTCEILQALQVAFSDVITLTLSSIIRLGFSFEIVSKIFSKLFSDNSEMLHEFISSLFALQDICSEVSSPDT